MDKPSEQKIYEFDDFLIDVDHRMLYRHGIEVPLAPKAVETLLALIGRRGQIVSKDEILDAVWPDTAVEESNLFLYLSILRKTLGKRRDGREYLETFRRRGYRFNGEVLAERKGVLELVHKANDSIVTESVKMRTQSGGIYLFDLWKHHRFDQQRSNAAEKAPVTDGYDKNASISDPLEELNGRPTLQSDETLAGNIGTNPRPISETQRRNSGQLAYRPVELSDKSTNARLQLAERPPDEHVDSITRAEGEGETSSGRPDRSIDIVDSAITTITEEPDSTRTETATSGLTSLAILPFRNLTRDGTVSFYSLSLADALITKLIGLRSLRVRPSSIIAKYEDYKDDPLTIAKELCVETVLASSYVVSDGVLRVTSQLIAASNGHVLWAEHIETATNDLLAIQDTITLRIVEGLQLNLGSEEAALLAKHNSLNSEAYEEYLRGGDCFLRYIHHSAAKIDIAQAVTHFERAVGLDPNFSIAFVALGKCYLNRSQKGLGDMQDIISARDALDKAIALDPHNWDALANGSYVDLIQGEKRKAHERMATLRTAAPQNSAVQFYSSVLHRYSGNYEDALRSIDQMIRLDPAALIAGLYNRARILGYQRRNDEALEALNKAARIEPQHPLVKFFTAVTLFQMGETSRAREILERLMTTNPRDAFRPHLAMCLSSLGEHTSARELLTEDLDRAALIDPDLSYWFASANLMEGEIDDAYCWFEHSIKIGNENLPWFENDPTWECVHDHPKFKSIIEGLKAEKLELRAVIRSTSELFAGPETSGITPKSDPGTIDSCSPSQNL